MLGLETPVERLQHMNQPAYEFYLNRNPGIDLAADRLEIGVCAQHNNGGIDVDLWWRSSIAGLFPVGEAAGAHGVARPGGAALNSAQVGATRAAQWIAAREQGAARADEGWQELAGDALQKARSLLEAACGREESSGVLIDDVLMESTRAMSDNAGLVRSRQGLEELARNVAEWRRRVVDECVVDPTSRRSVDRLFLVRDILDVQAVYVAAMLDHLDHGVGSRGSVLYTDPDGDLPVSWWNDGADLDVEEIFRHRLDSKAHHASPSVCPSTPLGRPSTRIGVRCVPSRPRTSSWRTSGRPTGSITTSTDRPLDEETSWHPSEFCPAMADTPIHGIPSPRDLRQSARSWSGRSSRRGS
ncbi:succinate dehydrogenase flavoprotein subunit [Cutibacterium acnes JCM 18920]|nr:succinate dehydrogenase flavoprotein subunit [Cutibacterium acnes JCM 18920]